MIEINNLSKKYKEKLALSNVNLKIPRGEIIGIFGENGAGKTTLMKSVLGLIKYDGFITLDKKEINCDVMDKLSFATCEHSFFPNLDAKAHAEFYNEHFPKFSYKRFNSLMEFFSLAKNKQIKNFSQGQQNQFEVIMALSQGADYIFMDEPFAGNDIFNREDFYKVLVGILESNETVVISTHLIEEVSDFIGRAILIKDGKIINDVSMEKLEEEGKSLVSFVKEAYHYEGDRVSRALRDLTDEEE